MPDYFVDRPRLERLLDDVGTRPLTLVIAPAGSGKTQLLANWVDHSTMPTAWLSLEEMDDDGVELWTAVIAALQAHEPGAGATAAELLTHQAPLTEVVGALLDDLDVDDRTASVLVLDDIHHLTGSAVVQSLVLFVQHLPSWLHVVVAGRRDPDWPLHRMRVRGQLAEVRFAELRLTHGEACTMLSRLAPDLTDDEIESSVIPTEGWAAGVQLAALAARRGSLDEVARPWRHDTQLLTADYVWHEVLAAGDADIVDLLMRLSVVDRFDTALGTSITGHPDVHQVLLRGEAQGLFVYRLRDDWFRIHPLVREAMLDELRRRGAHRELHARAARFLEDAGETVTALEQWLLAERHRDALRLLSARSTQLYDQGREELMARTLEAIPREVGYTDVPAMIDFAVSNMLFSSVNAFVDTVRDVAAHAERSGVDYSPHVDGLQAVASAMSGDWTAGSMYAKRSLAALGDDWWSDPAGRYAWNTVAPRRRPVRAVGRRRRGGARRHARRSARPAARHRAGGHPGHGPRARRSTGRCTARRRRRPPGGRDDDDPARRTGAGRGGRPARPRRSRAGDRRAGRAGGRPRRAAHVRSGGGDAAPRPGRRRRRRPAGRTRRARPRRRRWSRPSRPARTCVSGCTVPGSWWPWRTATSTTRCATPR